MEFILQTAVKIDESPIKIEPSDNIMIIGSCFAENIGKLMTQGGVNTCINPFGIIYNPVSIAETLLLITTQKTFTEEEVFEQDGIFKSYFFHSRHASTAQKECLQQMNESSCCALDFLQKTNKLIITLGTAFAFKLKTTQQIVANCHKTPARNFERILLNPEEIVEHLSSCITAVRKINPNISVIFTVSPIRHLRDGLHENQISKSILHYTVYQLQQTLGHVYYFPAYEIMIDELRDYRFYADDMIHPSALATQYIWEKFLKSWCSAECCAMIRAMTDIGKSLAHQWKHPTKSQIEQFVKLHQDKLNDLKQKYPHLDLSQQYFYLNNLFSNIL